MASTGSARWWTVRRAQNRKPRTYRCPFCGEYLPAMLPHALVAPEGDPARRRHAHLACVVAARKAGKLPTEQEWLGAQRQGPKPKGVLRRLFGGGRREPAARE
jgi:hypothetical protein